MDQTERRRYLIESLLDERGEAPAVPIGAEEQRQLLRALMNVRPAMEASPEFLAVQDAYLQQRLAERGGATDAAALPAAGTPATDSALAHMAIWRGDITLLAADGIVNAANNQMLGCFVPGHRCIDNAIHTYSGVQLRQACACLMGMQGRPEPTGQVKVTGAYNLPAHHVLHTVGPVVPSHRPGPRERLLLQSCYRSCLRAAEELGLRTLAFCCISTGVFGYPQEEAARLAVQTVREHLRANNSDLKVVFNVFLESDERIYQRILKEYRKA